MSNSVQRAGAINNDQNGYQTSQLVGRITLAVGATTVLYYSPIISALKSVFSYTVTTLTDSLIAQYAAASPFMTSLTCAFGAGLLPESDLQTLILRGIMLLYGGYWLISTLLLRGNYVDNLIALTSVIAGKYMPESALKGNMIGGGWLLYGCYWLMTPLLETIKSIAPYMISRFILPLLGLGAAGYTSHCLPESPLKNIIGVGTLLYFGYLCYLPVSALLSNETVTLILAPIISTLTYGIETVTSILAYGIPLLPITMCTERYAKGVKANAAISCITALCCAGCFALLYNFNSLEALLTNYLSVFVSRSLIWIGYLSCLSTIFLIEFSLELFIIIGRAVMQGIEEKIEGPTWTLHRRLDRLEDLERKGLKGSERWNAIADDINKLRQKRDQLK